MRRNNILNSIIASVLLTTATAASAAIDFQPKAKSTIVDINLVQQRAEKGNDNAQYQLALAYSAGQGLQRNDLQAIYWYEQAAKQGNVKAQYSLALMLEHGQAPKPDHQKAAALYMKAAKQGHVAAQYSLGMMYLDGKGLEQDSIKAWTWLALAAENGFESVDKVRDMVATRLSPSDLTQAGEAFVQLKNKLPEPRPASLMVVAVAGK